MGEVNTYCNENGIKKLKIESDPNANGFFEKMGADYIRDIDDDGLDKPLCLYEYNVPSCETAVEDNNESGQETLTQDQLEEIKEIKEINEIKEIKEVEETEATQETEKVSSDNSKSIFSEQEIFEQGKVNNDSLAITEEKKVDKVEGIINEASSSMLQTIQFLEEGFEEQVLQQEPKSQEEYSIEEEEHTQEEISKQIDEANEETDVLEEDSEANEEKRVWTLTDKIQSKDFKFNENYQPMMFDENNLEEQEPIEEEQYTSMEKAEHILAEYEEGNDKEQSEESLHTEELLEFANYTIKPISEDAAERRLRLDREVLEQKLRELDSELDDEDEEEIDEEPEEKYYFQNEVPEEEVAAAEEVSEEKVVATVEEAEEEKIKSDEVLGEKSLSEKESEEIEEYEEEKMPYEHLILDDETREDLQNILNNKIDADNEKRDVINQIEETDEEVKVKSEKEKMLAGEVYIEWGDEIAEDKKRARALIKEFNNTEPDDKKASNNLLKELLGSVGEYVHIEPDFKCTYGYNIHIGDNFYAGYNCVIVDNNTVTIGKNCILSPQVGIYTQAYPLEADKRIAGYEYAKPVHIGDNVWIGGGAIINPGVRIGNNVVIAPGSVVTSDVPDNTLVGGNPAKEIEKL